MISRRDFLKLATLGTGVLATPWPRGAWDGDTFPSLTGLALPWRQGATQGQADKLGRITVGKMDVFATPDGAGAPIGALYEDNVVPWIREVVGSMPGVRINVL